MGEEPRGFTYGVYFTVYQERVASRNEGYTILFFNEGKVTVDDLNAQWWGGKRSRRGMRRKGKIWKCS